MREEIPIPENEEERLDALNKYDLDEVVNEGEFKALTQIAARICKMPMAVINFIDSDRMWSIASEGMGLQDDPRNESVCQHTIAEGEPLVVKDLKKDPLFKDKDYVLNAPHIRYYAGVPLKTSEKHGIGTLCVYDSKPNEMEDWQIDCLEIIAEEIVARLNLRLSQKKLQELNQQKNDILHIVSHDMRNPLSGILGIAQLIKNGGSYDESELKEFMGMIEKNARHLLSHLNELMDVSQIESGSLELTSAAIDIKEVILDTVQLHRAAAKVKQIDLNVEMDISKDEGWYDEIRLEQILGNLITNAIKFTPSGGEVQVRAAYPVTLDNNQEVTLQLEVEDNGIGIPEKFVDILFTKYGEHGREGTSGEKSIGLGLPILKQLVEAHRGAIEVDTQEEVGTTFIVHLPQLEPQKH